jgi:hypothetical protein
LDHGLERREAPGVAGAFLDLREIADAAAGRCASLVGRHAARDVLLNFEFQVGIDFGGEIGVETDSRASPASQDAAKLGPAFPYGVPYHG